MQVILLLLTCNTREETEVNTANTGDCGHSPHLEDGQTGEGEEALTVQDCQLVVAQVPGIQRELYKEILDSDILLIHYSIQLSLTLLKDLEDFYRPVMHL